MFHCYFCLCELSSLTLSGMSFHVRRCAAQKV
uniref:Uncharacterized protein n=1 Tax=Siphoviridae sp. ctb1k4 TaxID=2826391 RepID=A0A8S5MTX5_9CAUD|nr:MAG TPA: hypothetical protein [Siphoviridae sp. ctb1k4]